MKKYKLKQWYPGLDEKWDTTHRYEYQSSTGYMCNKTIQHCIIIYKKELHPDFWELIEKEKTLLTTDDGIKITTPESWVYLVDSNFVKDGRYAKHCRVDTVAESTKIFYFERNADEYIWRNKRIFSYEDMMKAKHSILITNEDIEKSAKERTSNGK